MFDKYTKVSKTWTSIIAETNHSKKKPQIFKQHIDDSVKYRKHPGSILNFMRVWLYIAMVEGTAIVHVNFVVIFQVIYQIWNVTGNCAFRSSIWTTIRPKLAL